MAIFAERQVQEIQGLLELFFDEQQSLQERKLNQNSKISPELLARKMAENEEKISSLRIKMSLTL